MNSTYGEQLKYWAIRSAAMIGVGLALALIQRYVGVTIEPPPPPPVQVVIQPADGSSEPRVTVHRLEKP